MLRDPHPAKIIHFCWYFKVNEVWLTNCVITWLSNWLTWLTLWLHYWLTDWLTLWLHYWLNDWLTDFVITWLTDWLTYTCSLWLNNRLNDLVTELHLYSMIASLTEWLTYTCTLWLHYRLSDWLTPVLCAEYNWLSFFFLCNLLFWYSWVVEEPPRGSYSLKYFCMYVYMYVCSDWLAPVLCDDITDWLTCTCSLQLHYWLTDWLTNWVTDLYQYSVIALLTEWLTDLHLYSVIT